MKGIGCLNKILSALLIVTLLVTTPPHSFSFQKGNRGALRPMALVRADKAGKIKGALQRSRKAGVLIKSFKFNNLDISFGDLAAAVKIDGNYAILTNQEGKKLYIEDISHKKNRYLKIGNATYIVRNKMIDLSTINPMGNVAWFEFFGVGPEQIDAKNYLINLPILRPVSSLELFPVNPMLYPALVAPKVDNQLVDEYRKFLRQTFDKVRTGLGYDGAYGNIFSLMHMASALALNGDWHDYYLAQDVLNQVLGMEDYKGFKEYIIKLRDHLYLSYVGCYWEKWGEIISEGVEKIPRRTPTIFEKPVEYGRLPVPKKELLNWRVVKVEALTEKDRQISPLTDVRNEAFNLGDAAIKADDTSNERVVSVPLAGGTSTTVKRRMGRHKLTHRALYVIAERGKGRARRRIKKWINIFQARLGLIFGQNPYSKAVITTTAGGTLEGESDRNIRGQLEEFYYDQIAKRQIKTAMQRTGLVLNALTGKPLRYKDGHLAACAEGHLWAFLSVLMDKGLIMDLLKHTSGILCVGNGDNILNYPRAGMVGKILQARIKKEPLATVAICTAMTGDIKGGFFARVTYRNIKTGKTIEQVEIRDINEFPTRSRRKTRFIAVGISKEKERKFYQEAEKNSWFIEDILRQKKVAFHVGSFAVDIRLVIARIFGFNEQDPKLIEELDKIDIQSWVDKVIGLGEEVPYKIQPRKRVPNEDNTQQVIGYMREQHLQDFIVHGFSLLPKGRLKKPKVEILSIRREDFLPYKGAEFLVLDRRGRIVMDPTGKRPKTVSDLVANQSRYRECIKRLVQKNHYLVLGPDERVVEVIPVTEKKILQANIRMKPSRPSVWAVPDTKLIDLDAELNREKAIFSSA